MDLELEVGAFRGIQRGRIDQEVRMDAGLLLDVTFRSVQTASALQAGAAHTAGVVAAKAETDKQRTYAGMYCTATHHLLCLAVESHGRIGAEMETFLQMLAARATRDLVLEADVNRVHASIMARLRAQLSCVLVKAKGDAEVRYVRRLREWQDRQEVVGQQWDTSIFGVGGGGWFGGEGEEE
jgi:hypothetical protein